MLRPALAAACRAALAALVLAAAALAAVLGAILWDMHQARRAWRATGSGASFSRDGDVCRTADPAMVAQSFPCRKPPLEFRVFVIGSSQAMGTPYVHQDLNAAADLFFRMPNEGGLSTWLREYLQRLMPRKSVRVINAAKGAGDFGVSVETMREVVESGQADIVLVLEGNNERPSGDIAGPGIQGIVDGIGRRLRKRLDDLARLAESGRLPTYILTVPNNLRAWMPQTDGPRAEVSARIALAGRGIRWTQGRRRPDDPLDWFLLGCTWEAARDFPAARKAFLRAKDLDRSFFRMRSSWNDEIRRTRGRQTRVIDMERILFGYAKDGIPGSDLFLDYCHLTLTGNRLVAFEVAKRLQADLDLGGGPLALEDAPLSPFLSGQQRRLRRLYLAKKAKWLVSRLLSARTPVDAVNFGEQAELYARHADMLAKQVKLARQSPR
ncbi:MAG: hypothetical protein HY926_05735 [Elusimicrobia bacterium]|nr:hypothetical protein [Elusimicrobiota bacterium]